MSEIMQSDLPFFLFTLYIRSDTLTNCQFHATLPLMSTLKPRKEKIGITRILAIDEALRTGKYPNQSTLSKKLEVSVATVGRDLDFMRDRLNAPTEVLRASLTFDTYCSIINKGDLFMDKENLKMQNGLVPPRPGSSVRMICIKCNWRGSAKLPDFGIGMKFFSKPKCPNCGKKSLIKDPAVLY